MPQTNQRVNRTYKLALGYAWFTPLYDALLKYLLRERAFKNALIEQAHFQNGQHILDVGCGTGTLTILIKQQFPQAEIVGLDGDPQILAIARKKMAEIGWAIQLDEGMSYALPYPDGSFDRVVSSLMFHHLHRHDKERTFREIYRVLRPGGELHVADWGKPQNRLMRLAFYPVQLLDGFETTSDNVKGTLPQLFQEAGLASVQQTKQIPTLMGTIALYKAQKPFTG